MSIQPIRQLMDDHEWILQVLDKMEKAAQQLEISNNLRLQDWKFFVRFCRDFTDGIHHQKEEGYLFPTLEELSLSMQQGPIACMLGEHEMGRNLIQELDSALDEYERDRAVSIRNILDATTNYVALLRNHINKENQILFRMAEQILSLEEKQNLGEAFTKILSHELNSQFLFSLNQEFERVSV